MAVTTPKATVTVTAVASNAAVNKATLLSIINELKKLANKGYCLDDAIRRTCEHGAGLAIAPLFTSPGIQSTVRHTQRKAVPAISAAS